MKATRIIAFLVALTLIVLSAGMSWAVAKDFADRGIMPMGAVALGVPGQQPVQLGGMTRDQAKAAIQSQLVDPVLQKVEIAGGPTGNHVLETGSFAYVDVDLMVSRAMRPWLASSMPERIVRRVASKPIRVDVPFALHIDTKKLLAWSKALEAKVGTPALDSTMTVFPDGKLTISKSMNGHSIDARVTYRTLLDALKNDRHQVGLRVTIIKPAVTVDSFGKTITVVRSQRQMRLWDKDKLEVTYPVAVGMPGFPTPLGKWKVVDKVKNPSWTNPHNAMWGSTMPDYIPPGPSNPLGTRAIYLDAPGIRFHGTNNDWSVGNAASHGCMRMHMSDIEALFPLVPIGTAVYILP